MTTTATARELAFDPNHYLDCRRPRWEAYEDRGLIRFERPAGSSQALVFVDADCVDVLETLRTSVDRSIAISR